MITVAKDIKQYSKNINSLEELKIIAVKYAIVKNYVFSRFSGINSLKLLPVYKKEIRDKFVKSEFANQWKLPARYWKLALDEAVSNIKSEWSNTKNRVKIAVLKNSNLTEDEKYFICYILKTDNLLFEILTHKEYVKPKKIEKLEIREYYILNLIRRYIRKYKGNIPVSKKKRSFMIDVNMYKYKTIKNENVIEITGLKKNHRLTLILRDKNVHSGNLRVVIENDIVVIHKLKNVEIVKNTNTDYVLGIDKGYTNLFAVSSNNFYGTQLSNFLNRETERLNSINTKRNRIWALINKCIKTDNLEKADRIFKNNFGKIKYSSQKNKFNEHVKSYINHEIKVMLDIEKPTEIVLENLNFQSWSKKLPKHIKRKLSRWIKGYIQKRLEYAALIRQIKVTFINAAYTSQICSYCGTFGKRNGKTFTCKTCGTVDADYNASRNILDRKYDTEITINTPYKEVKKILLNRYNNKITL